ncbi:keratin-associated protein 13-1-like [Mesocricetus auratus]|uniref:Keratin-associated protein n=1 Tax=Mesocricetus auratus TaxID=10036 RepID=A0A3Q0CWI0_MESAU|nr:keratin-associated protein 13-1-like [Mesocricetus auratus]
MTCSCSSRNVSTSCRSCLPSSGSSCGSSYPSNLVYTTTGCSPSTCHLYSGCQETFIEPTSCQTEIPCYYPRSSTPCSLCQGTYTGSLSCGSSNFHSPEAASQGTADPEASHF